MKTSHFPKTYDFFLQDFKSCDLISWDFIGSPNIILGKKVLGIWKFIFPKLLFYLDAFFKNFLKIPYIQTE